MEPSSRALFTDPSLMFLVLTVPGTKSTSGILSLSSILRSLRHNSRRGDSCMCVLNSGQSGIGEGVERNKRRSRTSSLSCSRPKRTSSNVQQSTYLHGNPSLHMDCKETEGILATRKRKRSRLQPFGVPCCKVPGPFSRYLPLGVAVQ